jgi:hypothetical protein
MSIRILAIAVLSTAAVFGTAPSSAAERMLNRTFEVSPGGRLSVDLDGGNITVTGRDATRVVVRLHAQGSERELENLKMSAEQDAAGIRVLGKREGRAHRFKSAQVNATIEVPRNYNLELYTAGGAIAVRDLHGNVDGKTSGGHIDVEQIRGDVKVRTSGGRVNVKSVRGSLDVHTSGGAIGIGDVANGVRAKTSGGPIRVERASGPIDVHTSGGPIEIELVGANQGIAARTSGGSILLRVPRTTRATLNASTSGGRIKSELPVSPSESSERKLRGAINGGGPEILVRSDGGSIRIEATAAGE